MHANRDSSCRTHAVRAAILVLAISVRLHGATFTATSQSLIEGREAPTATLMQNGKILVAGGFGGSPVQYLDTLEIIDAAGNVTAVTPKMSSKRYLHTATLLRNGKVLLVGGNTGSMGPVTTSADLFDPTTGTITATGNLSAARWGHTATLLSDGRVLIAGGGAVATGATASTTAEIYNPADGTFTLLASTMSALRQSATAARLANGKVLIAGGYTGVAATGSVDLFDPAGVGSFTPTMSLAGPRYGHTMTVLESGKVLVAGGFNGAAMNSTEIYDTALGTFAPGANLQAARYAHSATLLTNGNVLLAGGVTTNSAELFDPAGSTSTAATVAMNSVRFSHTATMLPSGKVLMLAGNNGGAASATGEIYDLTTSTFTATGAYVTAPRFDHTATLLPNGKVLIAGGGGLALAELYDPVSRTFTATGNMTQARSRHTATLLPSGRVLICGGGSVGNCEEYDVANGTFIAGGALAHPVFFHTATLLQNGKVLIAGSQGNALGSPDVTQLYDPATKTAVSVGPAGANSQYRHTATLIPDGRVILAGGGDSALNAVQSVRVFDPATNTVSPAGTMTRRRAGHTATLLADGKILIAGGEGSIVSSTTADLYDPATGTSTGLTFITSRDEHSAAILPGGEVLLAGRTLATNLYNPFTRQFAGRANATSLIRTRATVLNNDEVLISTGDGAGTFVEGAPSIAARKPSIDPLPQTLCLPAALQLTGSGFDGGLEGSAGTFQSSPTNAPVVRVQAVDSGRIQYLVPSAWTATTLTTPTINSFPAGFNRISVVSNGVASSGQLVDVSSSEAPQLGTYPNSAMVRATTITVAPSSPPVFAGTLVSFTAGASGGFAGTITLNHATGEVTLADVTSTGVFTITVTATTSCALTSQQFNLTVSQIGKPAMTATAQSSASVLVSWAAVAGADHYDVFRSASGSVPLTFIGSSDTLGFTDGGRSANTTYLYQVQAIDAADGGGALSDIDIATTSFFTDEPIILNSTLVRAAHLTEARTAVNAVRVAAGRAPFSFSITPVAGQPVISSPILELRAALNEARVDLGLPPIVPGSAATSGSPIRGSDVTEIRNGVK